MTSERQNFTQNIVNVKQYLSQDREAITRSTRPSIEPSNVIRVC
jgi:hypothetical protein